MSLTRFLVQKSYALEESETYRRVKGFFFDLMENPRSRIRPWFDSCMIMLVLSSVFVLIYEVKTDLGYPGDLFEWFAVGVFLSEYLLRMWLFNDSHKILIEHHEKAEFLDRPLRLSEPLREILARKWDYMTQPMAIIDLLAIIPSYRPLRFLRIFLLFRLFKLFRYARSVNEFGKVLAEKRFELFTLVIFMSFTVFTAAAAIYFFEAKHEGGQVEHFFDGIYWALVTLSTVGYGDIAPKTVEGRVITLVLIVAGIGVISFTTSVIVSAFNEKMSEMRENRVFAELEKGKGSHTIVCGFGRVGQVVADQLAADRERFVIIERDPDNIERAKRKGYLVIAGYAEKDELLLAAGVADRASTILCLTGDDVVNVFITLTARYHNPQIEIISRANRDETERKLRQAGASHVISPFKTVGLIAGEYIGQPVAFEAIHGIISGQDDIGLDVVTVSASSGLAGREVGELALKRHKLVLFGVIVGTVRDQVSPRPSYAMRERRMQFNPEADFRLQEGDVLVLFGHRLSILHLKEMIGRGEMARMVS